MVHYAKYNFPAALKAKVLKGGALSLAESQRLIKDLEYLAHRYNELQPSLQLDGLQRVLTVYPPTPTPTLIKKRTQDSIKNKLREAESRLALEIKDLKRKLAKSTAPVKPKFTPPVKDVAEVVYDFRSKQVSTTLSKAKYHEYRTHVKKARVEFGQKQEKQLPQAAITQRFVKNQPTGKPVSTGVFSAKGFKAVSRKYQHDGTMLRHQTTILFDRLTSSLPAIPRSTRGKQSYADVVKRLSDLKAQALSNPALARHFLINN